MRLMGEAQGVAYNEQVKALGGSNIAHHRNAKGDRRKRRPHHAGHPGVGRQRNGEGGGIGTLLLLNLFRDQMKGTSNGSVAPISNGDKK